MIIFYYCDKNSTLPKYAFKFKSSEIITENLVKFNDLYELSVENARQLIKKLSEFDGSDTIYLFSSLEVRKEISKLQNFEETRYLSGNLKSQTWFKGLEAYDHLHKEDGPAHIQYYEDGTISTRAWGVNGMDHRENGPAYESYFDDGNKKMEVWYLNGIKHREDGPAYIFYNRDGTINTEEYYINGEELSKDAWEAAVISKAMQESLK